ncbi:hypothetical protein GUJ93_ZPchr0004g38784 [Zizania palustris]|uniref:Uncharacterized protein n=1 Tax=Zizania palustris TaxID=103762 RepID=A0A8J5SYL1_ZIZPA|nr:hypothetical protein GUJ93_ZPchr0004g38784 [Zizania palustris]
MLLHLRASSVDFGRVAVASHRECSPRGVIAEVEHVQIRQPDKGLSHSGIGLVSWLPDIDKSRRCDKVREHGEAD